ncbi:MAG: tyrosine-type recombinase/integrase [Oscillospiraceae bacterium]|nr:tyrosine-type recombinase/integrase [Oscillospiraceae bacterium]
MAVTQPIRSKQQVRALAEYYLHKGQLRNYVLVTLGVHTALRISDLLRLKWDDVYDFEQNVVRKTVDLIEKKTKKSKTIALSKAVAGALAMLAASSARRGRYLIENCATQKAIGRVQAYRIIRAAAENLGFKQRYSCHSLRKTFGYHAWKSGVSPVVIMDIYNHSSLAITKRYLGITQDDRDAVYLGLNFYDEAKPA